MKSHEQLNKLALNLCESFGLDAKSPVGLVNIVLQELPNLTLIFHPISENTSGICINNSDIQIISVNSCLNTVNQRFALAHELYHLLVENDNKILMCNKNNKDPSEKEADLFASYLLMSDEALTSYVCRKNVEKFNLEDIIRLCNYFKMDYHLMLSRLSQKGLINQVDDYKHIDFFNESAKRGFSTELFEPPLKKVYKVYGKYLRLIDELDSHNMITSGEKQELLSNAFRGYLVYFYNVDMESYFLDS